VASGPRPSCGSWSLAGRTAEAITRYEQTPADQERVRDADHLDIPRTRGNLADAYNAHARHPGVLAAQRRERARIRSERQQRWGRPKPKAA
jgi:hypothetical protein